MKASTLCSLLLTPLYLRIHVDTHNSPFAWPINLLTLDLRIEKLAPQLVWTRAEVKTIFLSTRPYHMHKYIVCKDFPTNLRQHCYIASTRVGATWECKCTPESLSPFTTSCKELLTAKSRWTWTREGVLLNFHANLSKYSTSPIWTDSSCSLPDLLCKNCETNFSHPQWVQCENQWRRTYTLVVQSVIQKHWSCVD